MPNLTQPADNPPGPPPVTPYFRRAEQFDRRVAQFAADLGLPPDPWAA